MQFDDTDFEPSTESEPLKEAIRLRIEAEGRITFEQFMAMALYHPLYGYYNSPGEKMGRQGDYLTSPEVHPIFGQLVARQLREMWELMGRPAVFDVLEQGAGNGLLCRDVLRWAQRQAPDFLEALRYRLRDTSEELVGRQRRAIEPQGAAAAAHAYWEDASAPLEAVEGCALSNELVDSFPVHRVLMENGELREIYVTWKDGRFQEEIGDPSSPALAAHFEALGVWPGEGCRAEVNLAAVDWTRQVAQALQRGFVMTFDYGYEAADLYAPWRRDGTLLCFYRHSAGGDPYARIGRQDMTSHVDFTTLVRTGEAHGLNLLGITTQERFLTALGIGGALAPPQGTETRLEEYYARRRAVTELTDPAGLGRIKVMLQEKGVGAVHLRGLQLSA
ncbi:MAG: SAM-dependent methyltransferase [Dehalococcoidia bacterium]|nr:SAM-dependent methyltransferase [Dehalococcoidia bacterium]